MEYLPFNNFEEIGLYAEQPHFLNQLSTYLNQETHMAKNIWGNEFSGGSNRKYANFQTNFMDNQSLNRDLTQMNSVYPLNNEYNLNLLNKLMDYWMWGSDLTSENNCLKNEVNCNLNMVENTSLRYPFGLVPRESASTNDANLSKLAELHFPYATDFKHVKGVKKKMTVYIWKYNGCNREFIRTWNILDHAYMHTDSKPYICNYCGKGFIQKGNLKKHLKTHEVPKLRDRKRFQCDYCPRQYTERYNYMVSILIEYFKLLHQRIYKIRH